jgi:hypothetical protein
MMLVFPKTVSKPMLQPLKAMENGRYKIMATIQLFPLLVTLPVSSQMIQPVLDRLHGDFQGLRRKM